MRLNHRLSPFSHSCAVLCCVYVAFFFFLSLFYRMMRCHRVSPYGVNLRIVHQYIIYYLYYSKQKAYHVYFHCCSKKDNLHWHRGSYWHNLGQTCIQPILRRMDSLANIFFASLAPFSFYQIQQHGSELTQTTTLQNQYFLVTWNVPIYINRRKNEIIFLKGCFCSYPSPLYPDIQATYCRIKNLKNNFSRGLSGYNPGYNRPNPSALHPDIQAISKLWLNFYSFTMFLL